MVFRFWEIAPFIRTVSAKSERRGVGGSVSTRTKKIYPGVFRESDERESGKKSKNMKKFS